jgi:hypothetical protein
LYSSIGFDEEDEEELILEKRIIAAKHKILNQNRRLFSLCTKNEIL